MPRFYCDLPLTAGTHLDLPEAVAHHVQVLRLRVGDTVTLFNGDGHDYLAELADVQKRRASVTVRSAEARDLELPFAIQLAQALPEGSKMDWIIEKAVELGVTSVQPLAAQRSVVRLSGERADKRQAHWQAVMTAAAEQCGRTRLAGLEPLRDFRQWVAAPTAAAGGAGTGGAAAANAGTQTAAMAAPAQRLLLTPRATQSLAAWARSTASQAAGLPALCLIVGPEGGLTPEEEALALQQGALALSMGPRVLRTETAGMAALAVLASAWGGM
jgi:16S rRNA (uracil1498-N3)-methyltransferase